MLKLAVYFEGGLGDIVHHYCQGLQSRIAYTLRRRGVRKSGRDSIQLIAGVYSANPSSYQMIKGTGIYDKVIRLDEKSSEDGFAEDCKALRIDYWEECQTEIKMLEYTLVVDVPLTFNVHASHRFDGLCQDAILLHPFSTNIVKTFLDSRWWMSLSEYLLDMGEKIVVIGNKSDSKSQLIDEFWDYANQNSRIGKLLGKGDIVSKIIASQRLKGAVVVDSCWLHIMQAFGIPQVLLIDSAFYKLKLNHFEDSEYDYKWHPAARSSIRTKFTNKVIPDSQDPSAVIFGSRYGKLPKPAEIVSLLRKKSHLRRG